MLKKEIEDALNKQLQVEAESSQFYLAMASWAETKGLNGIADFLFSHSDEERMHMLKLLHFINERGGKAIVPAISKPEEEFKGWRTVFENLLNHEIKVTEAINEVVDVCLQLKDYTTHNFMQWYVAEQIEEEALARTLMDKVELIGDDNSGLYLLDRELSDGFAVEEEN
ncbi:MAG TPA: ferritin [Saprospiraceae bacterium]|nr:ferritin [Saprospiraceae bacterium]